jgi:hypothetical protein
VELLPRRLRVHGRIALKKPLSLFALLCAAALYAAGCSSHATTNGWLPSQNAPVAGPGRSHRHHVKRATMYLAIPRRYRHRHWHGRGLGPSFISPATRSLTVAVSAGSASLPLQVFAVATPSPCTGSPETGYACQFSVDLFAGVANDLTLTTYAVASPNAASSPLSEYVTSSAVTPPPSGGALGFTLEGVVAHVIMTYPTSSPNAAPWVDSVGQSVGMPAGVATAAPLSVIPYDEAGYQILSQYAQPGNSPIPYFKPVTLSVSPAGSGVTLANDGGSGNSVTIANPNDLAVTVSYSGAVGISGGIVSPDTFSLKASGASITASRRLQRRFERRSGGGRAAPTTDAASVALLGNAVAYPISGSFSTPYPAGLVNTNAADTMFYAIQNYNGASANSILGTATSGSVNASTIFGAGVYAPFADSVGGLWVWDSTHSVIDCFASASAGTPTSFSAPSPPPGQTLAGLGSFAEDSAGDLWFTLDGYEFASTTTSYIQIAYFKLGTSPCTVSGPSVYTQTYAGYPTSDFAIAAIPNAAGVYVGVTAPTTNQLIVATTPSPLPPLRSGVRPHVYIGSQPAISATAMPAGQRIAAFVSSSSKAYALVPQTSPSPAVVSVDGVASGGVLTPIATLPTGLGDVFESASSPTIASNGLIGATTYSSLFNGSYVGTVNPNDTSGSDWEVLQPVDRQCDGTAYDSLDTLWVLCNSSPTSVSLYRILPTSTWTVLPGTTIPVSLYAGCSSGAITGEYFLGVLEGLTSTSGPFTLSSTSPNITSSTPVGDRGIAVSFSLPRTSGSHYAIDATVTDAHGRSMPIVFDVSVQSFPCSRPRPPQRVWRRSSTHDAGHRVAM